jgi:hypothetical protein
MRCRITLHRPSITLFRVLAEDVELHRMRYSRRLKFLVLFVYVVPRPLREAYYLNRCLLLVTHARHSGTF